MLKVTNTCVEVYKKRNPHNLISYRDLIYSNYLSYLAKA